eukprot:5567654-Prymnesium_polylepis.2
MCGRCRYGGPSDTPSHPGAAPRPPSSRRNCCSLWLCALKASSTSCKMMHAAAECDHTASPARGARPCPRACRVLKLSSHSSTHGDARTGGGPQSLSLPLGDAALW